MHTHYTLIMCIDWPTLKPTLLTTKGPLYSFPTCILPEETNVIDYQKLVWTKSEKNAKILLLTDHQGYYKEQFQ